MSNRRRSGGGGGHDGGQERWLLTYADMITLLLALFIVLFALSSIDAKKFDNLRRTLSQTFKGQVVQEPGEVLTGSESVVKTDTPSAPDQQVPSPVDDAAEATRAAYNAEREELEKIAQTASLKGKVNVETTERGIVVSLAGDEFFETGSAELKPQARRDLKAIAVEIRQFGREIDIEGHTDTVGSPRSNIVLSQDRAFSVWDLFFEIGVDHHKMQASGLGEAHPKFEPGVDELDAKQNRRIEIVILAPAAGTAAAGVSKETKPGEVATPTGPGKPVDAAPKPKVVSDEAGLDVSIVADDVAAVTGE